MAADNPKLLRKLYKAERSSLKGFFTNLSQVCRQDKARCKPGSTQGNCPVHSKLFPGLLGGCCRILTLILPQECEADPIRNGFTEGQNRFCKFYLVCRSVGIIADGIPDRQRRGCLLTLSDAFVLLCNHKCQVRSGGTSVKVYKVVFTSTLTPYRTFPHPPGVSEI